MTMAKVFISYHHDNDQRYKEHLVSLARHHGSFEDGSVEVGDIDDSLSSETIRQIIRDEYLRDTQVTILLCGTETRYRKHIDWELKSSMIDGKINRKSGILIINLPSISTKWVRASFPQEKKVVYGDLTDWISISTRSDYQKIYPDMPDRIIDNLLMPDVKMSIVPWCRIENKPGILKWLVDVSAEIGSKNEYDLMRSMIRKNKNQ